MATSNKRPLAVLKLKKKIGDLILQIQTIILNVTNNIGMFGTLLPVPSTFTTDLTNLETAEGIAKTKAPGSVAARNLKLDIVKTDIHNWQSQVQTLADNAATADDAILLITSAGLGVKVHGVHIKPLLAAKTGTASGMAELVAASAGKRDAHEWRMSVDGITWTGLPATLQAKTTVTGLTSGSTMHFQHRAVIKDGGTGWGQIVTLVIA